jgi:hypothetical protein
MPAVQKIIRFADHQFSRDQVEPIHIFLDRRMKDLRLIDGLGRELDQNSVDFRTYRSSI